MIPELLTCAQILFPYLILQLWNELSSCLNKIGVDYIIRFQRRQGNKPLPLHQSYNADLNVHAIIIDIPTLIEFSTTQQLLQGML